MAPTRSLPCAYRIWSTLFPALTEFGDFVYQDLETLEGKTALDWAKKPGHAAVVALLEGRTADGAVDADAASDADALSQAAAAAKAKEEMAAAKAAAETIAREAAAAEAKKAAHDRWVIASSELTWRGALGMGAHGSVYEVEWKHSRIAAKKVLVTVPAERERLERSMRREMRALQQARHPHIVSLLGVVVDEPAALSLLMELSPLGSLRSLLDTQPATVLSSMTAQLSLLFGIAAGMENLHAQTPTPILHHDLKTANVLVWPDASLT